MIDDDRLDQLLSNPLPVVDDTGFSTRVMAQIVAARERRVWFEWCALAAASVLFLAVLPLGEFSDWVGNLSYRMANSLTLAMAVLAFALMATVLRLWAD